MDCIKLLPEIVANQIAAGEVVNAPSNVVKEMMENALDAGAQCVRVNFRNGGKDLIQIVDDGCGMSAVDARLAFDAHVGRAMNSVLSQRFRVASSVRSCPFPAREGRSLWCATSSIMSLRAENLSMATTRALPRR